MIGNLELPFLFANLCGTFALTSASFSRCFTCLFLAPFAHFHCTKFWKWKINSAKLPRIVTWISCLIIRCDLWRQGNWNATVPCMKADNSRFFAENSLAKELRNLKLPSLSLQKPFLRKLCRFESQAGAQTRAAKVGCWFVRTVRVRVFQKKNTPLVASKKEKSPSDKQLTSSFTEISTIPANPLIEKNPQVNGGEERNSLSQSFHHGKFEMERSPENFQMLFVSDDAQKLWYFLIRKPKKTLRTETLPWRSEARWVLTVWTCCCESYQHFNRIKNLYLPNLERLCFDSSFDGTSQQHFWGYVPLACSHDGLSEHALSRNILCLTPRGRLRRRSWSADVLIGNLPHH